MDAKTTTAAATAAAAASAAPPPPPPRHLDPILVAVLTVSDTCSLNPELDTASVALVDALDQANARAAAAASSSSAAHATRFAVRHRAIVPDEPLQVQRVVRCWVDEERVHLVLTTGGTGFGARDSTPEAIASLIDKPTPALTHAITAYSLQKTPFAALSRGISGIRHARGGDIGGRTGGEGAGGVAPPAADAARDSCPFHGTPGALIITLPGSRKAVRECMDVLVGTAANSHGVGFLAHAVELVRGSDGKHSHLQLASATASAGEVERRTADRSSHDHASGCGAGHHHHHHGAHHAGGHHAPRPRTRPDDTGRLTKDPQTASISQRLRKSPYPLISLTEALELIARHAPSPAEGRAVEELPVGLATASSLVGRVLAEDVAAEADLPAAPTSNVDGYAVSHARTGGVTPGLYDVAAAGRDAAAADSEGAAARLVAHRINTGQALPRGTDSVVMVEDTELVETTKRRWNVHPHSASMPAGADSFGAGVAPQGKPQEAGEQGEEEEGDDEEESRIRVLASVDRGENVRSAGSDVRRGDVVLRKGTPISSLGGEVGTLCFVGKSKVRVFARPTVAILSTGNELVDVDGRGRADARGAAGREAGTGDGGGWSFETFDSNRPGLAAAIRSQGFDVVDLGIVRDDLAATTSALERGLELADVVVTTGGTSMGESDLLKPIIEHRLAGGKIHFGRVAMKPGKPTTFATASVPARRDVASAASSSSSSSSSRYPHRLLFALPGNPASALVCFYLFVLPALRKMSGHAGQAVGAGAASGSAAAATEGYYGAPTQWSAWSLPRVRVRALDAMPLDARPEFHRVVAAVDAEGALVARSTGSQRSSGMHSMATANALVCLPPLPPAADAAAAERQQRSVPAGSWLDAVLLGPLA